MKRSALALALTLLLSTTLGVATAGADPDPTQNKTASALTLVCEGETLGVGISPGQGGVSIFLPDDRRLLLFTAVTATLTHTDPETGLVVTETRPTRFTGQGRRTGQQGRRLPCTGTTSFQDPALGTVQVTLHATVLVVDRGQGR